MAGTVRMQATLVDQLGPDTIVRFVKSAPLRLEEGDFLSDKHQLTAIYLYGYAAEMILKAAYFKNLRYNALTEIDRDARNRAMALAQLNNLMTRDPHDIYGWARLLIWDRESLHTPAYEPGFSRQIAAKALTVYENWRPQMRYRNTTPPTKIVLSVRSATEWLINNYARM